MQAFSYWMSGESASESRQSDEQERESRSSNSRMPGTFDNNTSSTLQSNNQSQDSIFGASSRSDTEQQNYPSNSKGQEHGRSGEGNVASSQGTQGKDDSYWRPDTRSSGQSNESNNKTQGTNMKTNEKMDGRLGGGNPSNFQSSQKQNESYGGSNNRSSGWGDEGNQKHQKTDQRTPQTQNTFPSPQSTSERGSQSSYQPSSNSNSSPSPNSYSSNNTTSRSSHGQSDSMSSRNSKTSNPQESTERTENNGPSSGQQRATQQQKQNSQFDSSNAYKIRRNDSNPRKDSSSTLNKQSQSTAMKNDHSSPQNNSDARFDLPIQGSSYPTQSNSGAGSLSPHGSQQQSTKSNFNENTSKNQHSGQQNERMSKPNQSENGSKSNNQNSSESSSNRSHVNSRDTSRGNFVTQQSQQTETHQTRNFGNNQDEENSNSLQAQSQDQNNNRGASGSTYQAAQHQSPLNRLGGDRDSHNNQSSQRSSMQAQKESPKIGQSSFPSNSTGRESPGKQNSNSKGQTKSQGGFEWQAPENNGTKSSFASRQGDSSNQSESHSNVQREGSKYPNSPNQDGKLGSSQSNYSMPSSPRNVTEQDMQRDLTKNQNSNSPHISKVALESPRPRDLSPMKHTMPRSTSISKGSSSQNRDEGRHRAGDGNRPKSPGVKFHSGDSKNNTSTSQQGYSGSNNNGSQGASTVHGTHQSSSINKNSNSQDSKKSTQGRDDRLISEGSAPQRSSQNKEQNSSSTFDGRSDTRQSNEHTDTQREANSRSQTDGKNSPVNQRSEQNSNQAHSSPGDNSKRDQNATISERPSANQSTKQSGVEHNNSNNSYGAQPNAASILQNGNNQEETQKGSRQSNDNSSSKQIQSGHQKTPNSQNQFGSQSTFGAQGTPGNLRDEVRQTFRSGSSSTGKLPEKETPQKTNEKDQSTTKNTSFNSSCNQRNPENTNSKNSDSLNISNSNRDTGIEDDNVPFGSTPSNKEVTQNDPANGNQSGSQNHLGSPNRHTAKFFSGKRSSEAQSNNNSQKAGGLDSNPATTDSRVNVQSPLSNTTKNKSNTTFPTSNAVKDNSDRYSSLLAFKKNESLVNGRYSAAVQTSDTEESPAPPKINNLAAPTNSYVSTSTQFEDDNQDKLGKSNKTSSQSRDVDKKESAISSKDIKLSDRSKNNQSVDNTRKSNGMGKTKDNHANSNQILRNQAHIVAQESDTQSLLSEDETDVTTDVSTSTFGGTAWHESADVESNTETEDSEVPVTPSKKTVRVVEPETSNQGRNSRVRSTTKDRPSSKLGQSRADRRDDRQGILKSEGSTAISSSSRFGEKLQDTSRKRGASLTRPSSRDKQIDSGRGRAEGGGGKSGDKKNVSTGKQDRPGLAGKTTPSTSSNSQIQSARQGQTTGASSRPGNNTRPGISRKSSSPPANMDSDIPEVTEEETDYAARERTRKEDPKKRGKSIEGRNSFSGRAKTVSSGNRSVNIAEFFSEEVFQIVLRNPTTAHRFLKFCQSRASGENIEFLQKLDAYHELLEKTTKLLGSIHQNYISSDAPHQIDASNSVIKEASSEVRQATQNTIPNLESILTTAQGHVEELLAGDLYPRFVRHQITTSAIVSMSTQGKQFQGVGDCFCLSDPKRADNPIVLASDGFVKITGYQRGEIIPRNCRFLQGEKTDPASRKRLRVSIRQCEETVELILNYRKNGDPFWNLLYCSPLFNEKGEISMFLGGQIDCSTTVHSCNDVLRVLSVNEEELEKTKQNAAASQKPPPAAKSRESISAGKKLSISFYKSWRKYDSSVEMDGSKKLNVRDEAGMEGELISKIGKMSFRTQVEAFYTAYSKYVIMTWHANPHPCLLIKHYSPGIIDMLCLNLPNGGVAPIFNKDIFQILGEHSKPSSAVIKSFKQTIYNSIKAGKAVSVETGLLTGLQEKKSGGLFKTKSEQAFQRVEEPYVTHWTPMKDEDGRTFQVILTIAPKV